MPPTLRPISRGVSSSLSALYSMRKELMTMQGSGIAMTKRVRALSKPSCITRSFRAA